MTNNSNSTAISQDNSNNLSNDTNIVALVIAFVALFVTLCQLLGQIFATADGYRRCQPSVMGLWAKHTHMRWRWSQFRFETIFVTPEITLHRLPRNVDQVINDNFKSGSASLDPSGLLMLTLHVISILFAMKRIFSSNPMKFRSVIITGEEWSYNATLISPKETPDPRNEKVCWITLLHSLHRRNRATLDLLQNWGYSDLTLVTSPSVRFQRRSWDFMPPDVVRPFASATLSDVTIIAWRLGMKWYDYRPHEGALRAEGCGHVLTSIMVPSIGLIVQYTFTGQQQAIWSPNSLSDSVRDEGRWSEDIYIPTTEADKLGFGILTGNPDFDIHDFYIGTEEKVLATLLSIDKSKRAMEHIKGLSAANGGWTGSFTDLIPLAAPMFRLRGSPITRIHAPTQTITSVLREKEGFLVFHYRLKNLVSQDEPKREQRKWLLETYETLKDRYGDIWENENCPKRDRLPTEDLVKFLDDIHDCYNSTTRYFKLLENMHESEKSPSCFRYFDLIKAHMNFAIYAYAAALSQPQSEMREGFDCPVPWIPEAMHFYFDYLPRYVNYMRQCGFNDAQVIEDAWLTMIFRAFCWHRCHNIVESSIRIPSRFYCSQQPVFIG